ncbi:Oidioi.mRNA.OKI2018_I69.XSR.g15589.t1.cds [Oikopleura dioica]|uniref:Oidioi.mRNA.OKI2018_I69.XSR.g15589.t1.cds n=1 Tax=Oikopleura dioica TaxID=34765 RepID=A0ABN7SIH1_OIKDI|nr:Oidioi.mRNA.OKI2018_I69.XSR.g15589.t1.cds [Oikopleura dioica]
MKISVTKLWNGEEGRGKYDFEISTDDEFTNVRVTADFFNDPAPPKEPGYLMGLWDFEVAEIFFLNSKTEEYSEFEFGPHGHFLALKFKGARQGIDIDEKFEFAFSSQILDGGKTWTSTARIPNHMIPEGVDKFNCYGINGVGDDRNYLAFSSVPGKEPDYHRIHCFAPFSV